MSKTTIALASYNGERFIGEQIESLLSQECQEWDLLVCDDGSSDATLQVVEGFKKRLGDRLVIKKNNGPDHGASANFFYALSHIDSDYVFFCDQDDFWLPHKVGETLEYMRRLEREYPAGTPCVVASAATVTDSELRPICSMNTDAPQHDPMHYLKGLITDQRSFGGSTSVINRGLIERSLVLRSALPESNLVYDRLVFLLAAVVGEVGFDNEPTLLYRVHGGNTVGADLSTGILSLLRKAKPSTFHKHRRFYLDIEDALGCIEGLFGDEIDSERAALVATIARFPEMGRCEKWAHIKRLELFSNPEKVKNRTLEFLM